MSSLERILQKLDTLRELDPSFEVFGAAGHEYELNPALSEEELSAFEAEHRVKLPLEYRSFLKEAGNGGAGPVYGLKPLELWQPDSFSQVTTVIKDKDGNVIAEAGTGPRPGLSRPAEPSLPFALADKWRVTHTEGASGPDTLPEGANPFDGCTFLADIGCGYCYFLVITGPRAGEVWEDYTACDDPISPTGLGFFDWYERWLDESICSSALAGIKDHMENDSKWEPDELFVTHLASFEASVKNHPNWAMGQVNLGYMNLYLRRFDEVEDCLRKAEALDPKVVEADIVRVYVLRAKGDSEGVIQSVDDLFSSGEFLGYPTEGVLYKMKYAELKRLSRWPEVIAISGKVIQHYFYEQNLRYEVAFFHLLHKSRTDAEEVLRKAASDFCEKDATPDFKAWFSGFAHGVRINGREEDALYFESL
jgi:hypothetical protein